MSMNEHETHAAIIADVRREYYAGAEYDGAEVQNLIDRIEAAHKREVADLTEELETARHCWKVWSDRADELRTKCDEQYAKLKMVGNTVKVREILETIKQKAMSIIPGSSIQKKMLDRFRLLAESALAAPPRNCDRFNSGNAERDAEMAWDAITSGMDLQFSDLTDREIAIIKESMRGFVWLFTTADESEVKK